jgi:hypothetical protein
LELTFNLHQLAESSRIEMLSLDSLHEHDIKHIKTNRTRSEGRRIDVSAPNLTPSSRFFVDLPRCNV